jgi:hypothetical protein
MTAEGENWVLSQQHGRFLLKLAQQVQKGGALDSQFQFLQNPKLFA